MISLFKFVSVFFIILSYHISIAATYPFCSSGSTDSMSLSNSIPWTFNVCYVTPSTLKVKIDKIALVESGTDTEQTLFTNSAGDYIDLVSGISNIASNITPIDGTYYKIKLYLDRDWYITASADIDLSGVTQYCRTRSLRPGDYLANTSVTGDGHGSSLGGSSSSAEEMIFRHNAFNFVSPNASGSENQTDEYGTTYPYFSKMYYAINSNNVYGINHYFINSSGILETNSRDISGSVIEVQLTNAITINTSSNQIYKFAIDITKSVAFAATHTTDGSTIVDDSKCNYLTIGVLPVSLTISE